jgi:hypothetical protein
VLLISCPRSACLLRAVDIVWCGDYFTTLDEIEHLARWALLTSAGASHPKKNCLWKCGRQGEQEIRCHSAFTRCPIHENTPICITQSATACREGRQLIYDLSAKHHNCLLLNYAIQKILRAGHEDEVASIGSSLASYFGVFHRLLANRLKEVPTATVARLRQLSTELRVPLYACCASTMGEHLIKGLPPPHPLPFMRGTHLEKELVLNSLAKRFRGEAHCKLEVSPHGLSAARS